MSVTPSDFKNNLKVMGKWIPSGVGKKNGWFLTRKIDLGGGKIGLVYEIDDELERWRPRTIKEVSLPGVIEHKKANKNIDWDSQPLGQVTDKEVADKLGVSESAVCQARKRRGIPGTRECRKKINIDWDSQPLGKEFDSVIARELNVDPTTVGAARNKRGIPKRHIDWDSQPLGEESDSVLAKKLGVDNSTVAKCRRRRGIKAKHSRVEVDWEKEPLGKISDCDIARGLGINQSLVSRARQKLGIPPFDSNKKRSFDTISARGQYGREEKDEEKRADSR